MSVTRAWLQEFILLIIIFGSAAAIGHYFWQPSYALIVALLLYLIWHLIQLFRLSVWLRHPKKFSKALSIGAWATAVDAVTKLRKRERKRKRKLEGILNSFEESTGALPDATIVLNNKGAMEWWNPAANSMFGLRPKKDRGRLLLDKIDDAGLRDYLAEQDYDKPLKMISPVNPMATLEIRVVPYGGGKRLFQGRDISRLHQLETVRQDFVANVSHEMRTPLTVIHGYLETMSTGAGENDLSQWQGVIGQMQQQTARLQRIVEDLLLLSRLDSGTGRDGEDVVVVAEVLSSICEEARRLSGDMDHVITLDAVEDINLRGNGGELYSLFSNLIFNAVRYTPARGEIDVKWESGGKGPCFSVTDTGIGIAKEHLPRLTERFYRVDVGRSRKSGGTGLGLAIVKHVLNRHGGQLEIESEPGVGSTFRCCFPEVRVVSSRV